MNAVSQLMSPVELLNLADAFFEDEKWIEAYTLYRGLCITPSSIVSDNLAGIENKMGVCAKVLGNNDKAIEHFWTAFDLESHSQVNFENLVTTLADDKQFLAAVKLCDDVLQKGLARANQSYEATVYKARGLCHNALDYSILALSDLNRALEMKAEDKAGEITFTIGNILLGECSFAEAIPYFDKVDIESELYLFATNSIGACFMNLGQAKEAQPYFEEALAFSPNSNQIRNNLFECLATQNNWSEALVHISHIVDTMIPTEPNYVEKLRCKVICLRELGHIDAAKDLLDDALQMEPDNYRLHSAMARIHYDLGHLESGFIHTDKSIAGAEKAGDLFYAKGALEYLFMAAVEGGEHEVAEWVKYKISSIEDKIYQSPEPF